MHRIDTPNARADANGAGKAGYHLNTDMSGVDPTNLDPAALNALQEEICSVIEAAEVELEKGTNNQLLAALQLLFAAIGGNASKLFSVANGLGDTHAVNKLQLDNASLALAISLAAEITARENLTQQATQLVVGISRAASQAEVNAGTVATEFLSPLTAKNAPWAAKAYVLFEGDGTILKAYKIANVERLSTGSYKLTHESELDDTNYLVLGTCKPGSGTSSAVFCPKTDGEYSTEAVEVETYVNTATPTLVDCNLISVVIF